jgi:hypothetical protein
MQRSSVIPPRNVVYHYHGRGRQEETTNPVVQSPRLKALALCSQFWRRAAVYANCFLAAQTAAAATELSGVGNVGSYFTAYISTTTATITI